MSKVKAINWTCGECKAITSTTPSDDGILVPRCQRCHARKGKAMRCVEGVIVYEDTVDTAVAPVANADVRRGAIAREALKGELFRRLCAVLDANRIMSGGGTRMDNTCVLCEGNCLNGRCACACHAAWALRAEVVRKAEAA